MVRHSAILFAAALGLCAAPTLALWIPNEHEHAVLVRRGCCTSKPSTYEPPGSPNAYHSTQSTPSPTYLSCGPQTLECSSAGSSSDPETSPASAQSRKPVIHGPGDAYHTAQYYNDSSSHRPRKWVRRVKNTAQQNNLAACHAGGGAGSIGGGVGGAAAAGCQSASRAEAVGNPVRGAGYSSLAPA